MVAAKANSINIEYEESGDRKDPAIMLIRGLGTQLIDWADEFVHGLVDEGYRVVRHDNRDVGWSEKFEEAGIPNIVEIMGRAMAGKTIRPPYTIGEMALDVIGLMDVLDIQTAHIVGMSMGGMIAQHLAIGHSSRLKSMTSIMSGSGNPDLPAAKPEATAFIMNPPRNQDDREAIIAFGTETLKVLGSPGYPESEEVRRKIYTARYDRCYYPPGVARQMAAIVADGSRVERLKTVAVPTLVIHGLDDPLVPVEGGKDTAALIPNAKLELIEGMAHNIPVPLCPKLVGLIVEHCRNHD